MVLPLLLLLLVPRAPAVLRAPVVMNAEGEGEGVAGQDVDTRRSERRENTRARRHEADGINGGEGGLPRGFRR